MPNKKPSFREKSKQAQQKKPRRLKLSSKKVSKPLGKAKMLGGKEFHPIKLPDNRFGRLMNKRVRFMPKFLRESWAEIKQVTWPTPREMMRLTIAVFIFAVVLSIVVASLDAVLDRIFKELIIK